MSKKNNMTSADMERMGYIENPNKPGEFIKKNSAISKKDTVLNIPAGPSFRIPEENYFKGMNTTEIMNTFNNPCFPGLFIPYEVPSSKNSRIVGDGFSIASKQCSEYKQVTKLYWESLKKCFNDQVQNYPVHVSFKFIRKGKNTFDLTNAVQIVQDLMTDYKWLPDDNMNYLIPDFKEWYAIDRYNPGVIIKILK